MLDYRIDFDSPWYLTLLVFVPLLWWFSYRSLAGLGPVRRLVAMGLRTVILVLFIFAAADIRLRRVNEGLTVIYLLDQSRSIPVQQRKQMVEYVNAAIREHWRQEDRVGVIVFGRDAAIEIPPFDDPVQVGESIESLLDPDYTNLAGAMKLAQASFPEDTSKRIVIISDGNENLGDALEQAGGLADSSVGIDVVPVRYSARAEVMVEKVTIPSDVHRGEPFDLRVVVNNTTKPTPEDPGLVSGKLIVSQTTDDQPVVISQEDITLAPGKRVFTIRQEINAPDFYTYEARFVPDKPEDDGMPQNNRATMFTHVRGSGQVLLIENFESRGEHGLLVERLKAKNLEVTVRPSDQLFTSLPELQQYDTVLLADVPREHFSDQQIKMLVSNTEFMGSGLVMLGGPNSFGAGGWANTDLEKAMPVDFQIKSAKVVPKGALAMIMHASEIAQGNYWQKIIGVEALKALGSEDYCGVLHWDGNEKWLWGVHPNGMLPVGRNRDKMLSRMDRMVPGDMPDFDPTLIMARQGFASLPKSVGVKHMIIISDGDPSPATRGALQGLVAAKVTVSTVAVGAHGPANSAELQRIAKATGGKYYQVKNNKALPRIFQREARRVARPLVYENPNGFQPRIRFAHEMLSGIDEPLPPITGYVMTTVKQNPLVETSLVSPLPAALENNTLMASWTYGIGKAVVFTGDTGTRWSKAWTAWENYDKFFSQLVRWSMRPVGEQGKFTVVTDVQDEKVRVIVTALDQDDRFLNFLDMAATAVGPDMQPRDVKMEQTAPGRYIGSFDARDSGSYFVMLAPGAGQTPIRAGVDVPYSAEFRDNTTDDALLTTLAEQVPKGGPPGKLIDARTVGNNPDGLLAVNSFRHDLPKATTSRDAWHWMVLIGSCLFFFDVFFRRVTVSFAWVPPLAASVRDRLTGRETVAPVEYMQRLRSRKAEVTEQLEQQRAATRFEPAPDAPASTTAVDDQLGAVAPPAFKPAQPPASGLAPDKEQDTYTSRLLKAKKKVWEERKEK